MTHMRCVYIRDLKPCQCSNSNVQIEITIVMCYTRHDSTRHDSLYRNMLYETWLMYRRHDSCSTYNRDRDNNRNVLYETWLYETWLIQHEQDTIIDNNWTIVTSYRVPKIHRIRYDTGHFPPIWPTAKGSFGENDLYYNEPCESWPPCIIVNQ